MINKLRLLRSKIATILVVLMCINSFAAVVADNDGAAFITKAEFESLKNDFQTQINRYNTSLDSKIDGAISGYVSGISMGHQRELKPTVSKITNVCWQDYMIGAFNCAKWSYPGSSVPSYYGTPDDPVIMRPIFNPYRAFYDGGWQFTTEQWTASACFDVLMFGKLYRRSGTYVQVCWNPSEGAARNQVPQIALDLVKLKDGTFGFSGDGDILIYSPYNENQWAAGPLFDFGYEFEGNMGRFGVCNNLGRASASTLRVDISTKSTIADFKFNIQIDRTDVTPTQHWSMDIFRNKSNGYLPPVCYALYGKDHNLTATQHKWLRERGLQALDSRQRNREEWDNAVYWVWPTEAEAKKQLDVWENLATAYIDDTIVNGAKLYVKNPIYENEIDFSDNPTHIADVTLNKFIITNALGTYANNTTRATYVSTQTTWPTFEIGIPTWIRASVSQISNGKYTDGDGNYIRMCDGIQIINDVDDTGKITLRLEYTKGTSGDMDIADENKILLDLKKTNFSKDTDDENYVTADVTVNGITSKDKKLKRYEINHSSKKCDIEFEVTKGDDCWIRISPVNKMSETTKNLDYAKIKSLKLYLETG